MTRDRAAARRWWRALGLATAISVAIALLAWIYVPRFLAPDAQPTDLDPAQALLATQFLDRLDRGEFDAALAMTTPRMQAGLGNGKIAGIWTGMPAQLGPRRARRAPRGEMVGGAPVVTISLDYLPVTLDARVVFDGDNRISGFWLVPGKKPAPENVQAAAFVEHDAHVGSLPATLTLPRGAGPFPGVVFVHGSGPQDRDQSVGPNRPFRDLAHGLAERGVASLRYDKRTHVAPAEFADGDFTVDDETTNDAAAALAVLRTSHGIDAGRVFLLGHSQGAMMAPRIARGQAPAGVILLAAPARPLQDVYLSQIAQLAPERLEEERRKHAALASITPATAAKDTLLGLPARYWLDLRGYDPVAQADALPLPLLVLQGERDYQVTPADDFARWQAAFAGDPRATLRLYPALNHLFIAGNGPPSPAEYQLAGHVDAAVIGDIAAWVEDH